MKEENPIKKLFLDQPVSVEDFKAQLNLEQMWVLFRQGQNLVNQMELILSKGDFENYVDENGERLCKEQVMLDKIKALHNMHQLAIAIKETEHFDVFIYGGREFFVHQN